MLQESSLFSSQHLLPALLNTTIGRATPISHACSLIQQHTTRLLTLTGPGGIGKTRMAIEMAHTLQTSFPDGVYFVPLAPLIAPTQFLSTIAQALALEEVAYQPTLTRLLSFLHTRKLLLVLDNFEHILDASTYLTQFLTHAPNLQILVTSREKLHLYGEYEFIVPSLSLPDPQSMRLDTLATSAALTLFTERAQAVNSSFQLTSENIYTIANICIQLDGLPLAIELAAARCKLLTPQALLARLQNKLHTLVGGARDLPTRHQTLRNTIDWSYNLLSPNEQLFFRQLGIFSGSWTLEAAHAICQPLADITDTFDTLASLVDKSLLRPLPTKQDIPRFQLLETIREYAQETLKQHNELTLAQDKHTLYYLHIAEEAAPHLISHQQAHWLSILDQEAPNIWQAMHTVIAQQKTLIGLRMATALIRYLMLRHMSHEGRTWLEDILKLPNTAHSPQHLSQVLYGAGVMAHMHNDLSLAQQHFETCQLLASTLGNKQIHALALGAQAQLTLHQGQSDLALQQARSGLALLTDTRAQHLVWTRGILHSICAQITNNQSHFDMAQVHAKLSLSLLREAGDLRSQASVLVGVGNTMRQRGKLVTAYFLFQKALTLFQELDDQWGQLICLNGIGDIQTMRGEYHHADLSLKQCYTLALAQGSRTEQVNTLLALGTNSLYQGDTTQASHYYKESLRLARELSYTHGIAHALRYLAELAYLQEKYTDATSYYEQSLPLIRNMGDRTTLITILCGQGQLALALKHHPQATLLFKQAIHLAWEINATLGLSSALAGFAQLCNNASLPERAVQFLATSEALRVSSEANRPYAYQARYDQQITKYKTLIGDAAFYENWSVGQNMSLPQTLGMIANIRISEPTQTSEKEKLTHPANLTTREVEVLRLLAIGHTDARIAQELVLSPRTVNTHLRSIYAKIGVSSRSAATRFALEHKLA